MDLLKVHTTKAPQAIGPYSQAIKVGGFIFVSGQLPLDPETGKLVEGDMRVQVNRILDNIEAILTVSNSSWKGVVKTEIFLKDLTDFAVVNEEYSKRVDPETPPARQTIQAAKLPLDAKIEISCIAVLAPSFTDRAALSFHAMREG